MRLTKPIVKLLAVTTLAALTLFLAPSIAAVANTSGDHGTPTLRELAARLGIHVGSEVDDRALSAMRSMPRFSASNSPLLRRKTK